MVSSRIPSYKMAISLHRSFKSRPFGASSNCSLISRDVASERPKESVPNFEKKKKKKCRKFRIFYCCRMQIPFSTYSLHFLTFGIMTSSQSVRACSNLPNCTLNRALCHHTWVTREFLGFHWVSVSSKNLMPSFALHLHEKIVRICS